MKVKDKTFDWYQKESRKTADYPKIGRSFIYPALGLSGETGELLEKIKKLFRDRGGKIDKEFKKLVKLELGDILWYLTQIATDFNIRLSDVAFSNIKKLSSRKKRGKIRGDGDLR